MISRHVDLYIEKYAAFKLECKIGRIGSTFNSSKLRAVLIHGVFEHILPDGFVATNIDYIYERGNIYETPYSLSITSADDRVLRETMKLEIDGPRRRKARPALDQFIDQACEYFKRSVGASEVAVRCFSDRGRMTELRGLSNKNRPLAEILASGGERWAHGEGLWTSGNE